MSGDFDTGFEVDGEPLAFYHFTVSTAARTESWRPRNATASPSVQKLIAWYAREIEVAEHDPVSQWPWAFGRFFGRDADRSLAPVALPGEPGLA
jgi:hypothetical protein